MSHTSLLSWHALCACFSVYVCVIRCLHPVLFRSSCRFLALLDFFSPLPMKSVLLWCRDIPAKGTGFLLTVRRAFFVSTGRSLDPFSTERRLHKGLHNTHIHSAWQRGTAEQKKKEGKINSFGIRSQASHSHRVNAICMPRKAWQSIINGSNKRNNAAVIEGISP